MIDAAVIAGKALTQTIKPVEHTEDCPGVEWLTKEKAEFSAQGVNPDELEEGEAVCKHCGVKSEVRESDVNKNLVVDVAGAEYIAQYIAGQNPGDFVYMKLGSTATVTAPTEGDTQLSNTVRTSPSLTPTIEATGGADKVVVWSNTFSSGTESSIVSLAMDTTTANGTGAKILNRVTFPAKDLANNDLAVTYKLTVS